MLGGIETMLKNKSPLKRHNNVVSQVLITLTSQMAIKKGEIPYVAGVTKVTGISVWPREALMDEQISIKVIGLPGTQKVTIYSYVDDDGKKFGGHGHFVSDDLGILDLSTSESLSGSYLGVDQMGLFWSMKQKPGQKKGIRLVKHDLTKPLLFEIQVFKGHITESEIDSGGIQPLATTTLSRNYMSDQVERCIVRDGRVRGTLFTPKGQGTFPAVVDMYGSAGGLIESRAALLATKGFVTLALAFFGYDDLPTDYTLLEVKYFQEAIEWLLRQPKVLSHGVGMIAISYGAALIVHLSQYIPQIKAIVSIGGGHSFVCSQETDDGVQLVIKGHPDFTKNSVISNDGTTVEPNYDFAENWKKHTNIKLDKTDAQFLFVHGLDDKTSNPISSKVWVDELETLGKSNVESAFYEGCGHLIEPPYTPHNYIQWHNTSGMYVVVGGTPEYQIKAEVDSWGKIINFFHRHLGICHVMQIDLDLDKNITMVTSTSDALMDEKINIKISGFDKAQMVTIHSYVDYMGKKFSGFGHYVTDEFGNVDTATAASLGGTYFGVNEMGLFCMMNQKPGQAVGLYLRQGDVSEPYHFILQLFQGHLSELQIDSGERKVLVEVSLIRKYLANNVERHVVKLKRVRGTFFIPKGNGHYPGIMDLFGSGGGLVEYRAALLASKGFAAFAVAYVKFDNLPKTTKDLELSYFEEAIDWLLLQPRVLPHGVGVISICYGTLLAVHMAQYIPKIKAVVAIASGPFGMHNEELEDGVHFIGDRMYIESQGLRAKSVMFKGIKCYAYYFDFSHKWKEYTRVKLEDTDAHFLIVTPMEDMNFSPFCSKVWIEELERIGKNNVSYVKYDGAGHLIIPPYHPIVYGQYTDGVYMLMGGKAEPHLKAEVDCWKRSIQFLYHHLSKQSKL